MIGPVLIVLLSLFLALIVLKSCSLQASISCDCRRELNVISTDPFEHPQSFPSYPYPSTLMLPFQHLETVDLVVPWVRLTAGLRSMRDHKFAIFRLGVECETQQCIYASLLSAWGASIHAPGDFCVLQVQVDRDKGENHQKIFFCSLCLKFKLNPNIFTSDRMVLLKFEVCTMCRLHVKIKSC